MDELDYTLESPCGNFLADLADNILKTCTGGQCDMVIFSQKKKDIIKDNKMYLKVLQYSGISSILIV